MESCAANKQWQCWYGDLIRDTDSWLVYTISSACCSLYGVIVLHSESFSGSTREKLKTRQFLLPIVQHFLADVNFFNKVVHSHWIESLWFDACSGNLISISSHFTLADESWYSFLKPSDWEILIMDAILDVHTEDGKPRTMRVTIPDNTPAPPPADCTACKSHTTPPPLPADNWIHLDMIYSSECGYHGVICSFLNPQQTWRK